MTLHRIEPGLWGCDQVLVIRSDAVATFAGLTGSSLRGWKRDGICTPSVPDAHTRGTPTLWTVRDAVVLRFIQRLRGSRIGSLAEVSVAVDACLPADLDGVGPTAFIDWDGARLQFRQEDDIVDAIRTPNRFIASFFGVHELLLPQIEEATQLAFEIDTDQLASDPSALRRTGPFTREV